MRPIVCAVLLVAGPGCSPVAPWPSFYPAEYTEDQIEGVPRGSVAMACRSCPADAPTSEVCAAVHPLEKPVYCGGRTSDGRLGVLVPVQMEHRYVGETRALLSIRDARVVVGDESVPSSVYYSDFGREDFSLPGDSRTLTVGFVVAEEAIRAVVSFLLTCPCPGHPGELFEFEFVARGDRSERSAPPD